MIDTYRRVMERAFGWRVCRCADPIWDSRHICLLCRRPTVFTQRAEALKRRKS